MSDQVQYWKIAPEHFKHLQAVSKSLHESGLPPGLVHLVFVRASQLNGCAFCINMHTREALKAGEDERRLHLLAAWREARGVFTPQEQAALAWTEALTLLPVAGGDPSAAHEGRHAAYQRARELFSESELVNLGFAIAVINAWNRLAVGFESPLDR